MTLKISLKPHEAVYVGTTKITVVTESNTTLLIEGSAPILRANERIDEPAADDHAARLQYVLQQMYLLRDTSNFHEEYFALAHKLTSGDAEMARHLARINQHLVHGEFYKALKLARLMATGMEPPSSDARSPGRTVSR